MRDAVTGYLDPDTMVEVAPIARVYKAPTNDNESGLFTKALPADSFRKHRDKMVHDCTTFMDTKAPTTAPVKMIFDMDVAHVYAPC